MTMISGGRFRILRRLSVAANHAILWIAVLWAVIPMLWIVVASLQTNDRLFQYPPNWWPAFYWGNFESVLTRTQVPRQMLNSALISAATAVLTVATGALAAYPLGRIKFKLRNYLLFAVLGTQMIPGLSNIIPLYIMIQNIGGVDNPAWLVVVYTAGALPLAIWMLTGFYQSVPSELEEAAMIDGCTPFAAFWRVILPLVAPGIAAMVILTFANTWNEFVIALTLITSSELKTFQLGLYDFLSTDAQTFLRYGNLHAAAVLGLIPTLIAYMVVQRQLISGITAGAVKG